MREEFLLKQSEDIKKQASEVGNTICFLRNFFVKQLPFTTSVAGTLVFETTGKCNHSSKHTDPITILQLSIPIQQEQLITLEDCFSLTFSTEELSESEKNQWACEECFKRDQQ